MTDPTRDDCTCRLDYDDHVNPACPVHKPKWTDLFGIDPNYTEGMPEEPTLTASEVKVLTETAGEAGRRIGRKEACDEVAAHLDEMADQIGDGVQRDLLSDLVQVVHDLSLPSGAASDATSGVRGHPEVSEAVRSPQEPCGHPTCPCASQEAR